MGLDMYLHKRKLNAQKGPDGFYSDEDDIEIGYWRKANAIHEWFNQNCAEGDCENCEIYDVSKSDLIELIDTCERVLSNHDLAEELLPPSEGFFFGSTEIDEYYFRDLQETIEICKEALNVDFNEWKVYYYAWW